ncbi:aromatic ring-hydroxylating dioxygenase subunit alpha [uncultured Shimia sp.]|uniref:aromatic ring-hydroxylating oxygenase subunit alpha n=1 Tax=uncultured Shimia sp. TaxID=573152 RepID=UPI00260C27D6|nr:aromatic ring-hydroxylating dioxygenase subunit alpha [uncultured Shimia sp.]
MPDQILPATAYTSDDWFRAEQASLFQNAWHLAGFEPDFAETGDYVTLRAGKSPLAILKDGNGNLRAFHNLCRHRGTELLEGRGNAGKTLVCPYHRWTYGLDGRLRGVPDQRECFPDLNKSRLSLHDASVGKWKGMVFANADPNADFAAWIAEVDSAAFPHDLTCADLQMGEELVYRMHCNWKVFFENAIDGYHLAYLHENTLGGPKPGLNHWDVHGQAMVWYSTERDGIRNRIPKFVEDQARNTGTPKIKGAEDPGYGGVYMLFPTTIITPSPWSLTVSTLEPVDANTTIMRARTWVPKSWWASSEKPSQAPGYDPASGEIQSRFWTQHPLETGDFQTEDIWVCEKMQRSLHAPNYSVGALAQGTGGEDMLEVFQRWVREAVQ